MQILEYSLDFLKKYIPNFKVTPSGKRFTCPVCADYTASFAGKITWKISCTRCGKTLGTIIDILKRTKNIEEAEALKLISSTLQIPLSNPEQNIVLLDFYEKEGFDLVPIASNQKIPIEKDWVNKEHKTKREWLAWLESNVNIGVKTGAKSNLTIIDIDTDTVPDEIQEILKKYPPTLVQKTGKGWHFFFRYVKSLPTTRIDVLKTDILNDGKQCLIAPSIVDGHVRKYVTDLQIIEMPEEFLIYLKKQVGKPLQTFSEKLAENISKEEFEDINLTLVDEGGRTNFLMHLGGILRKELNSTQTEFVLGLCNNKFCKPSLPQKELFNIIRSIDKYTTFDEQDLAVKILNHLKIVEEAGSKELADTLGFKKERVDRALSYLQKEGFIIKRRKDFIVTKKANWKDVFPLIDCAIDFVMPFFNEFAVLNWGDMILLGSKAKYGKTTISMNFIKSFVQQGKKPYYICLETGSRFIKTALKLGMKEQDFYWDFVADPTKIELEPNAITIIDWLLIEDKALTDATMKYFVEQLYKTNGVLIVFMQLKVDGTWFAPNMVGQFPSLMARYLYTDNDAGVEGKWILDVIREPKMRVKGGVIPCYYKWDTHELLPKEDLNGTEEKESKEKEESLISITPALAEMLGSGGNSK